MPDTSSRQPGSHQLIDDAHDGLLGPLQEATPLPVRLDDPLAAPAREERFR